MKDAKAFGVALRVIFAFDAMDHADGPEAGIRPQDSLRATHAVSVLAAAGGVRKVDAEPAVVEFYPFDGDVVAALPITASFEGDHGGFALLVGGANCVAPACAE